MTVREDIRKTVLALRSFRATPAEGETGNWINMSEPHLLPLMAFSDLDITRSGFF
jgi:hypothetical protein